MTTVYVTLIENSDGDVDPHLFSSVTQAIEFAKRQAASFGLSDRTSDLKDDNGPLFPFFAEEPHYQEVSVWTVARELDDSDNQEGPPA